MKYAEEVIFSRKCGMTNKDMENAPYRWMGCSLLVIVLTSGLGVILFRKKEIR